MASKTSVFNGSAQGFVEQVNEGVIPISIKKVEYKVVDGQPPKPSKLYNSFQIQNGVQKEIYFRLLDLEERPLTQVGDKFLQDWSCDSIETDNPTEIDIRAYDLKMALKTVGEKVPELCGLDPTIFPPICTSIDKYTGKEMAWFLAGGSSNSKNAWTFEDWMSQKGEPTFKVKSWILQEADPNDTKADRRTNYVSGRLQLGFRRYDTTKKPEPKKRALETETATDKLPKIPKMSAAAIAKRKTMRLKEESASPESIVMESKPQVEESLGGESLSSIA